MSAVPIIRLESLTKRFGGVTALDDVSFEIAPGEVHAVVGENGAGKSTLMKILAGAQEPDAGHISLGGERVRLRSPLDARRQGISIVYQELNLFPTRTVTQNIFAGRERRSRLGLLDQGYMRRETRAVLNDMGAGSIDVDSRLDALSLGERQMVEIARALQQGSKVVILDEPNSALNEHESARLFDIIRRLRGQGVTFIYVSHRLEEVFAIADRISVIRDGRYEGTQRTSETTIPAVIDRMVGRRFSETFARVSPLAAEAPVALRVRGLRSTPRLGPVDFDVRRGEIVGFAGLEGAGVETLFKTLFGIEKRCDGTVDLEDEHQRFRTPADAIREGWAMIPASRREEGLFMNWTVRRNAAILVLEKLRGLLRLIDRQRSTTLTHDLIRQLSIVTASTETNVVHLSGGNQQKVLLGKWLATGPRVLILNDPTRGVDVGAKAEIHRVIARLASDGLAILFSSSELEETLAVCDRVIVMHRGRAVREFARGTVAKSELVHWISGRTGG